MRLIAPGTMFPDITYDLLCQLSWKSFDAVHFGGWVIENDNLAALMTRCDSLGMYYSVSPREIERYHQDWAEDKFLHWFRNSSNPITSSSAFARCDDDFSQIERYMSAESLYALNDTISIRKTC